MGCGSAVRRWIASEDAGLYRDALEAVPPGGHLAVFLEGVEAPLARPARRADARPVHHREVSSLIWASTSALLRELERAGDLVGERELRPEAASREWCEAEVLRRLRRLARDAPQGGRAGRAARARALPSGRAWTALRRRRRRGPAARDARSAAGPCACAGGLGTRRAPAPSERVLARLDGPALRERRAGLGRAGALGRNSGRVALLFREDAHFVGPPPHEDKTRRSRRDAIRERLERGAAFWTDLLADVDSVRPPSSRALWDLAWAGESRTTPSRAPGAQALRSEEAAPAGAAPHAAGDGDAAGCRAAGRSPLRCSRRAVAAGRGCERSPSFCSSATASYPRGRPGRGDPWRVRGPGLRARQPRDARHRQARVLRRGPRRAQFALPAAIERLRGLRTDEPAGALVLAATDPFARTARRSRGRSATTTTRTAARPGARRLRGLLRLGAGPLRRARRQGLPP